MRVVSNANADTDVDIYSLPRVASTAATASVNSDGRLKTFVLATNGALWNTWQTAPHADPWSGWNKLT